MKTDLIDKHCNICKLNNHNPDKCDYVSLQLNPNLILAKSLSSQN